MTSTRFPRLILNLVLIAAMALSSSAIASASDSQGVDFWLAFPTNYSYQELTLFISGTVATTGTVAIPGVSFTQAFTVTPGTTTSVTLSSDVQLKTSDTVENKGIHVTAANPVGVWDQSCIQCY